MSASDNLPLTRLHGTSQGSKAEHPPDHWIRDELRQFGSIDVGRTWTLSLTGTVHPIFEKRRWVGMPQDRYEAMHQSLLLATKLLSVARPYLCNFLPRARLVPQSSNIVVDDTRSVNEMAAADTTLIDIAESIQWTEFKGRSGLYWKEALIHDTKSGLPETNATVFLTETTVTDAAGATPYDLEISVPSEYVDALVDAHHGYDQYLTAAFLIATNLVRALGYAIISRIPELGPRDLWIGDDVVSDPGQSLVAWLFDGWYPAPSHLGNDEEFYTFRCGMHWRKQLRAPVDEPLARYFYSMPLAHAQRMFDQRSWNTYNPDRDSQVIRERLLAPQTPFRNGFHARLMTLYAIGQFQRNKYHKGYKKAYDLSLDTDVIIAGLSPPIDEDWQASSTSGSSGRTSLAPTVRPVLPAPPAPVAPPAPAVPPAPPAPVVPPAPIIPPIPNLPPRPKPPAGKKGGKKAAPRPKPPARKKGGKKAAPRPVPPQNALSTVRNTRSKRKTVDFDNDDLDKFLDAERKRKRGLPGP